jgi:NADP-dependent aldehyde dehydrogenase
LTGAGAPEGIFAVIDGVEVGVTAVKDPRIAAASFTGSVAGGRALFDIANARPVPIPFYGELGSVNPVVVTPGAAAARGAQIAAGYAGSFALGTGQFCTKPGLLFLPKGHDMSDALRSSVQGASAGQMLTEKIQQGFDAGVSTLRAVPGMQVVADGPPTLLAIGAADFVAGGEPVHEECFGPASIVIEYGDANELIALLAGLQPGLTATVQGEESEAAFVAALMPVLTALAGRVLWNDWPTGVTVSWAQQHGGPYPATTTPTTTSVGTAAIERFLRPVAWQGFPDVLLPPALREDNPWQLPRRVDGKLA